MIFLQSVGAYHKKIKFDYTLYAKIREHKKECFKSEYIDVKTTEDNWQVYSNFDDAFYKLMIELVELQVNNIKSISQDQAISKLFVDGGFSDNDVYEIYKDNLDNLWISTIKNGLYKFDGKTFKNYAVPKAVMSVLKDKKGKIWLGCAGGLFRLNSEEIINVTTSGPWN